MNNDAVEKVVQKIDHMFNNRTLIGERYHIVRAAIEAYEQEQWQPIDTAPKDGTEVLLSYGKDCFSGYWEAQPNHWHEIGWQEEDARQGAYIHRHPQRPTHWRPLPTPPKEKK